ncbi:PREDICTED: pyridoxine-5'-phosphate oxidase-like [Acropora digitifera]|uniref:pyridoxine-5'-phosphate oxidase-like n=1 Tax=Acropora digitifera TaxID=70779 RepID=UPI000779FDCC|nr:PREDICTED: pyridoxine-5'-phosphate oxidase-like [Acropora digitifera]
MIRLVLSFRSSPNSSTLFRWKTVNRFLRIEVGKMMRKEDVAAMRIDYKTQTFDDSCLVAKEPFMQFDAWFKEARTAEGIGEANAMVLTTCGRDCRPRARVVLLKGYDETGFTFYTNYSSKKGQQLNDNPYACLLFYWHPLHRQVNYCAYILKNMTIFQTFRGGFKVVPDQVEFWQGQSSRLHDRLVFRKPGEDEVIDENFTKNGTGGWVYERLAP